MPTQKERLKQRGIRHFDEVIHDQSRQWLTHHFQKGADEYPINVALFMRNIIWQLRERIQSGQREPLRELVRTFWYMHIKPVLARTGSLANEADQYDQLVSTLTDMVKKWRLMEYKDIGFRDHNKANRHVGINANVIVFAEKIGHVEFLSEIHEKFQTSTVAFGGQPSVINNEYFVDDLKDKGVDLRRSFFLFSIVDYDPSGWSIRDSFVENLHFYGIKHIKTVDLIIPDMLSPFEISQSRFPVRDIKTTRKKNTDWLRAIKKASFQNQEFLGNSGTGRRRKIYGLEAEAISIKRLQAKLDELLPPLLGKSEDLLKIHNLERLNQSVKELIVFNLTR